MPKKLSSAAKSNSESPRYWLVKSEPDVFSIDDLARSKKRRTCWDGVRNYQARNFLRDQMKIGDLVLFYHSSVEPPGVAGVAKVVRAGYPDDTAFDETNDHFDRKSNMDNPTWYMVDLQLVRKFKQLLTLPELRQMRQLAGMTLLQRGSRLSVQPVRPAEFQAIVDAAK